METTFCQSCGMPLASHNDFGTNRNQTPNADYCKYCFQNGVFTQDCTMDELILHCVQFLEEFNEESGQKLTKEEAIAQMKQRFPTLKRWMA